MTTLSPCVEIFPNGTAGLRVQRIKDSLRGIADSFINVGEDLAQAFRAQEWTSLGLDNFTQYCGQFNMTDSLAYDLVRIADLARSFPAYRARMLDAGVSNMRLLLPHVDEEITEAQVETLVDAAATKTWKELRKTLNESAGTTPPEPVFAECPYCRHTLELGRATYLKRTD